MNLGYPHASHSIFSIRHRSSNVTRLSHGMENVPHCRAVPTVSSPETVASGGRLIDTAKVSLVEISTSLSKFHASLGTQHHKCRVFPSPTSPANDLLVSQSTLLSSSSYPYPASLSEWVNTHRGRAGMPMLLPEPC